MVWTTPRTWTDGELVTASTDEHACPGQLQRAVRTSSFRKTADESVTSSTAFQMTTSYLIRRSLPMRSGSSTCARYDVTGSFDLELDSSPSQRHIAGHWDPDRVHATVVPAPT